jgi:hypothetical protein
LAKLVTLVGSPIVIVVVWVDAALFVAVDGGVDAELLQAASAKTPAAAAADS